jgi:hemerythrin
MAWISLQESDLDSGLTRKTVKRGTNVTMYHAVSVKNELDILNSNAMSLQKKLRETALSKERSRELRSIAAKIARQLDLEERTMDKAGWPLTSIHLNEHRKLLETVALLEFSWKNKRISDDVYIKALSYKLEFHRHYFDEAQFHSVSEKNTASEETCGDNKKADPD